MPAEIDKHPGLRMVSEQANSTYNIDLIDKIIIPTRNEWESNPVRKEEILLYVYAYKCSQVTRVGIRGREDNLSVRFGTRTTMF